MWSIRFKLQLFLALILFSLLSLMIWLYISASCLRVDQARGIAYVVLSPSQSEGQSHQSQALRTLACSAVSATPAPAPTPELRLPSPKPELRRLPPMDLRPKLQEREHDGTISLIASRLHTEAVLAHRSRCMRSPAASNCGIIVLFISWLIILQHQGQLHIRLDISHAGRVLRVWANSNILQQSANGDRCGIHLL